MRPEMTELSQPSARRVCEVEIGWGRIVLPVVWLRTRGVAEIYLAGELFGQIRSCPAGLVRPQIHSRPAADPLELHGRDGAESDFLDGAATGQVRLLNLRQDRAHTLSCQRVGD